MNAKILMALVIASAMGACTNSQDVLTETEATQTPITLGIMTEKASRAALEATTLPTDGTYDLYAYGYFNGTTTSYFSDLECTANSTDQLFETGMYWPLDPTTPLDFYAYSVPDGLTVSATSTHTSGNSPTVALTTTLDGTKDIMYSNILANKSISDKGSPQNLTMNHALAWLAYDVNVKVTETTDDGTESDVTYSNSVSGGEMAVSGDTYGGVFKVVKVEVGDVNLTGTPTFTFAEASTVAWTTTEIASTQELDATDGLLIVPITSSIAGKKVTLTYQYPKTYKSDGSVDTWTDDLTYVYTFPAATTDKWQDGKKYIFTFNIDMSDLLITFTGSVTEYESVIQTLYPAEED